MTLQTCRRHPSAGRFMATCSGCTKELYDIQAHNEAMAAALRALAAVPGEDHTTTVITNAKRTHTGYLIVAADTTDQWFPYSAWAFRRPTTDELLDPDHPASANDWLITHTWGADDETENADHYAALLDRYSPRIDLTV